MHYTPKRIAGFRANLKGAVTASEDGAYAMVDLATAQAIVEILDQYAGGAPGAPLAATMRQIGRTASVTKGMLNAAQCAYQCNPEYGLTDADMRKAIKAALAQLGQG